jgi:Asp-tRNA(Asn)/Glu-tRNA(Gln) amidotransferase B subunit
LRRIEQDVGFYSATVLVTGGLDRLWEATTAAGADATEAANVIANQFVATGIDPAAVDASELAKLVVARADIPRAAFHDALAHSGDPGFRAEMYLAETAIADVNELDPIIDRILEANEGQVQAYRSGKEGLLGFFVGQVMRETQGKANAKIVNERLREKLRA